MILDIIQSLKEPESHTVIIGRHDFEELRDLNEYDKSTGSVFGLKVAVWEDTLCEKILMIDNDRFKNKWSD